MTRRLLSVLLGAALLLTMLAACSTNPVEEQGIALYYVRADNQNLDSALGTENWDGATGVEVLFTQLAASPLDESLSTLIPTRTTIKAWQILDGVLYLDLSGEFGTLNGIDLTLASYCIVLTMCQLEDVDTVCITADGEALMEQVFLTPAQVMLDGGEGDTSTLTVQLYFPLADGTDVGTETRTLTITENRTRAETILDALCIGPEDRELQTFLPDSDQGITLWIKETICYVNLTEEWQTQLESDRDTLAQKLLCMVCTLCQLDEVESVQFLMDGAAIDEWSDLGADFPLETDFSLTEAE